MLNEKDMQALKDICDDSTTVMTVRHMMRGDRDMCMEYFGQQDDECVATNKR